MCKWLSKIVFRNTTGGISSVLYYTCTSIFWWTSGFYFKIAFRQCLYFVINMDDLLRLFYFAQSLVLRYLVFK